MTWIKRNLFFVIGGVVTLALLGGGGFYIFTRWQANAAAREKLNEAYTELKRLYDLKPHPGDGQKVDNINLAKEQTAEVRALLGKTARYFQRLPAIPDSPRVTGEDFAKSLRLVIDQLQREATNSSVMLPPKYGFSFEAERSIIKFGQGLDQLAVQLGEVKAIVDVLNRAKVNALEGLRRERVSTDDNNGPVTDYLDHASVTNDLAVLSPYEVTFRCFSAELAAALSGFANCPNGIIVKAVNVEPAPALTATMDAGSGMVANPPPIYAPQPTLSYAPRPTTRYGVDEGGDGFARRYGGKGGAANYPAPAPVTPTFAAAPAVRQTPQTFLDEKQLRVTMLLYVTKMLPPKP